MTASEWPNQLPIARAIAIVAASASVVSGRGSLLARHPSACPRMVTHRADLELVQRCLAGDPKARDEVGQRLACIGRILAARNRRTPSPLPDHALEDVAGEVRLSVWHRLELYNGFAALESWLFRFCELTLLNAMRGRRRQQPQSLADVPEPIAAQDEDSVDCEFVQQALARLPEEEFSVVHGKHFQGLTFEAMAERYRVPLATAKGRYYRALVRLKGWLRGRSAAGGHGEIRGEGEGA